MCGIVNAAFDSQLNSSSFNPTPQPNKPYILWKDDNFTVYKETANPVSSMAHVIVAFKSVLTPPEISPSQLTFASLSSPNSLHVPSIYRLVSILRVFRMGQLG